ncbi:hypothetical protein DE146DRAFT_737195 [Phaeosphaeria sp. MPI-PUGE-AT-0046c]|nr:hypothetical protein DE146DRAFT_737195 [Phaeosphaeria sp. MPI-PUGE-AT-0046c]
MAKKKNTKALPKKEVFVPDRNYLVEQTMYAEDPNLNILVETMPIEEYADNFAVEKMPVEEPSSDSAADEVSMDEAMPELTLDELTKVEPLNDVGVEDVSEELSKTCGSIHRQPSTSPYTKPPVELLIGPDEIIHYVPRNLLSRDLDHSGSMKQLCFPDMDVGTGHTFVHYFHTGLYEAINAEGSPTELTISAKFKQALYVYLATINHGISSLNELAISEMRAHASRLDLVELIRAIGENFQSLGPESWVHEFLQQKAKAAFEENRTVFTSDAFLDALDNSKVNKLMMRCMATCYDDKISNMGSREKEMSETSSYCQQSLRVLSREKVVPEQSRAVEHQFITPFAGVSTISECCGIENFQDDLVSNEDFCTISCPTSECSNEPRGCVKPTDNSAEPREQFLIARNLPYEADPAGPIACEQRSPPTYLAPDLSREAIHKPISGSAASHCNGEPKGTHYVLELPISKGNVLAQPVMNERKETKKQRKLREKKELQEMKELWETMKQKRSDTVKDGSSVTESVAKPKYQDKEHKDTILHVGGDDKRITDLRAALTAIVNDVESIRSLHGI